MISSVAEGVTEWLQIPLLSPEPFVRDLRGPGAAQLVECPPSMREARSSPYHLTTVECRDTCKTSTGRWKQKNQQFRVILSDMHI